ncbi:MAG: hypothetical protein ACLFV4_05600, partial [Candidatus Hydrogenedentota bacterium]
TLGNGFDNRADTAENAGVAFGAGLQGKKEKQWKRETETLLDGGSPFRPVVTGFCRGRGI